MLFPRKLPTGEDLTRGAQGLGVSLDALFSESGTRSEPELQCRVLEASRTRHDSWLWILALLSARASVASADGAWYAIARRTCFAVLATGLLVSMASTAHTASNFTGNDWRPLAAAARGMYVLGVIDGVLEMASHERRASPTSTTENSLLARIVEKLERCAGDRMTREQAVAIVEKYVTDHPEKWHLPMAGLVLIAMGEACPS
jgi:hypothetical protein